MDYADVFLFDYVIELPKNTGINEYTIELVKGSQIPYGPIYILRLVELETLKTYIETHLKTGFIWPFKSSVDVFIFFDWKLDRSFHLYIDYYDLNNLTIQNWYPLSRISKALDKLDQAKCFIQLDLTSAYYKMIIWEYNKWKTAFYTRYGHFKYQVILFGPSNIPASFRNYINKILAKKLNIFVIVYLNDILINTQESSQPYAKFLTSSKNMSYLPTWISVNFTH